MQNFVATWKKLIFKAGKVFEHLQLNFLFFFNYSFGYVQYGTCILHRNSIGCLLNHCKSRFWQEHIHVFWKFSIFSEHIRFFDMKKVYDEKY